MDAAGNLCAGMDMTMTDSTDHLDPVPDGYRFDVVWRGYHRAQVNEFLDTEVRLLAMDRSAAMSMVDNLARRLEESRLDTRDLREHLDRQLRSPLPPDGVDERIQHLVGAAHAQAANIVARARATAEHSRTRTEELAARQLAAVEQRCFLIEEDFRIAMAARRAEAMNALRRHEDACRVEAERVVREANTEASRRIASAAAQVDILRRMHQRLARRLRMVGSLFDRAYAITDPGAPPSSVVDGEH